MGPDRGDYQAAVVAHTFALAHAGRGRKPKLSDFLLRWAPKRRQTSEEQLELFRALAARQGQEHGNDR